MDAHELPSNIERLDAEQLACLCAAYGIAGDERDGKAKLVRTLERERFKGSFEAAGMLEDARGEARGASRIADRAAKRPRKGMGKGKAKGGGESDEEDEDGDSVYDDEDDSDVVEIVEERKGKKRS